MYSKFSDFNSYNMATFDNIAWSFIIKSHLSVNYTISTTFTYIINTYTLGIL
ncbi:hypothetical protein ACUW58_002382 [Staphylococcus saprophyticus]